MYEDLDIPEIRLESRKMIIMEMKVKIIITKKKREYRMKNMMMNKMNGKQKGVWGIEGPDTITVDQSSGSISTNPLQ